METIIASLITGVLSLTGVVITCSVTNRRTKNEIKAEYLKANEELKEEFHVAQAVTNEQIKELTREVRKHNNFAERMPVVENEIKHIEDDIHDLQKYHSK